MYFLYVSVRRNPIDHWLVTTSKKTQSAEANWSPQYTAVFYQKTLDPGNRTAASDPPKDTQTKETPPHVNTNHRWPSRTQQKLPRLVYKELKTFKSPRYWIDWICGASRIHRGAEEPPQHPGSPIRRVTSLHRRARRLLRCSTGSESWGFWGRVNTSSLQSCLMWLIRVKCHPPTWIPGSDKVPSNLPWSAVRSFECCGWSAYQTLTRRTDGLEINTSEGGRRLLEGRVRLKSFLQCWCFVCERTLPSTHHLREQSRCNNKKSVWIKMHCTQMQTEGQASGSVCYAASCLPGTNPAQ